MTRKPTSYVQSQLIQFLEKTNTKNENLCQILEDTLGISKSAAYKRIRCEKELSLYDIVLICQKFHVSVDQFILPPYARVGFGSDALRKLPQSYTDYLLNISKHLNVLKQAPNVHFEFLADEMPLFHYINFPPLMHFKLFVWNNSVWKFGRNHMVFNPQLFKEDHATNDALENLIDSYYQYHGTEVWTQNLFDPTIAQIKYYLKVSAFIDRSVALDIFKSLKKLRVHLESIAERGLKARIFNKDVLDQKDGKITIFYNNLNKFNTTILAQTSYHAVTYVSMDVPNFISSRDPSFCEYMRISIEGIKSKSVLISKEGELERKKYFKLIDLKLDRAEEEIQYLIKMK